MQNRNLLLSWSVLLFFTVIAATYACKKSNASNSGNSTSVTISPDPKVAGTTLQSSVCSGKDVTVESNFHILFSGISAGDSLVFELIFPDSIAVNKPHPLGGSQTIASLGLLNYGTGDFYSTDVNTSSGTMTVTALDKNAHTIQGNFSAIVWKAGGDSLLVSNGKFTVNYLVK